jgi:hypothetical protein
MAISPNVNTITRGRFGLERLRRVSNAAKIATILASKRLSVNL